MSVNFTLPDSQNARKPSVFAAACFFALAAAGQLARGYILYPIALLLTNFGIGDDITLICIDSIMYYGLFIVLPILLYMRSRGGCLDAVRVNPLSALSAMLCAMAAIVGVFFMQYVNILWLLLIEAFGGTIPTSGIPSPRTMGELFTMIIFVAVLPGLCEELLFRGVMLGAWQRRGLIRACVIVAAWFALLHASIQGFTTQFTIGLLLAFIVITTNSLMAGVVYHTVHNAVCLVIAYFASFSVDETAAATEGAGTYELLGGAIGVASVLMNILVFGLALFFILRVLAKRHRDDARDWREKPKRKREYTWAELAVMCSGGAIMGMFCLVNILEIVGFIK